MVASGKNTMELIIAARDRTGGAFTKVKSRVGQLGGVTKKVTAAMKGAAKAGALIGGAAVVAGIVGSTKAFMDFEDAMANVRKTTGLSKKQIEVMGEAINGLALKIPVAQTELAAIAATAGQLGIVGQKSIMSFTETVAKMTTAFDMTANDVAIAMAKLTNIYDIPIEQVGNLGSAINVLGNTTAASEAQLMAFSMSLGPTGQQLGFTATEALSLGASMVSIGMDASNAGTRLSRAFSMIGQNLDELAGFMGVSTEEFTASFEDMPMETFMGVLEKLSQVEGKLKANTIASELFNEIGAKAIKGLTGDLDGLRTNLKSSAEGFEANTSLTEEFAAKTDTLKARFQLLKNSVSGLLIDIGGELAPTLNQLIDGFRNIIPPLKDLIFEIGSGFSEMFESITRQAGPALNPLIEKVKEAGDKISSGLNFKTLLDDIGVFIGAGLGPLIRGFTWLIDKLGPLWELIGKGATLFHNLANALKTEEGRLDDILDATEGVTKAKQDLFDINEKLRGNVETLADALEKAGGWTTTLAGLEADASLKSLALAGARIKASEAIAVHGANSDIAKTAIENVKLAEEAATVATTNFNTAVNTAAEAIIDEGVATEGLEKAQLEFITSTETAVTKQGELQTAVIELEKELEEAKAAPFNLGEAFTNFGKLVARIFLEIPLKIAEAILKVQETISGGLEKIGLGRFREKLDADTEHIKEKIVSIRESLAKNIEEPLSEDIPKASEEMKDAVTGAAEAIIGPAKRVKEGVEDVDNALEDVEKTAADTGEAGEKAFEKVEVSVDKASGKVTVLTDDLGDTADSFEDNEKAAKTLLKLDWDVFSKLESELPNINSGIGDMTAAFEGLEEVLVDNLENLESVKDSVSNISELTAPFMEKGFMNGVKSIGAFANILKDAGSAINTFSSLQEVSIEGCINFSLHVNDMVSALRILENQMDDLVPAFGEMDSLISDVAESFLYSGERDLPLVSELYSTIMDEMVEDTFIWGNSIHDITEDQWKDFRQLYQDAYAESEDETEAYYKATEEMQKRYGGPGKDIEEYLNRRLFDTTSQLNLVNDAYLSYNDIIKFTMGTEEERDVILQKLIRSNPVITAQMDKQTDALGAQTKQLSKITTALEPYLKFMQTLNDLARLSTLSTEELNNGLHAIDDTLVNLGSALATFDLAPAMETLFGDAGTAEGFLLTTAKYESKFGTLINYIDRMAVSLTTLTGAFEAFSKLSKSVLMDQDALRTVFEDIVNTMSNFDTLMGKSGFGDKIAKGFKGMLASAEPLIFYFRENNAAVEEFNSTLLTFKITLQNIISAMDALKTISETTVPSVEELGAGFDKASQLVKNFDKALMDHVGAREGQWDMDKYFNSIFQSIKKFTSDWNMLTKEIGDTPEAFGNITSTIIKMISNILSLTKAFKDLADAAITSTAEMTAGFDKASLLIKNFEEGLMLHVGAREGQWDMDRYFNSIFENIKNFAKDWNILAEDMENSFETFEAATSTIIGLFDGVLGLSKAFTDLGQATLTSEKDMERATRNMITFIGRFTESLRTNLATIVDTLFDLSFEWVKHSKMMEIVMPSYSAATGDISTLIGSLMSLISALKGLSEMGSISASEFNRGFRSLNESINNFATSFRANAPGLVKTLQTLRDAWMENEAVLVPLMRDFVLITKNFASVAINANIMIRAFKELAENSGSLEGGFKTLIAFIKDVVANTKEFYTPEAAAELARFIQDVDKVIGSFADLDDKIATAVSGIETEIGNAVGKIELTLLSLEDLNSTMFNSGVNLMDSLIDGIESMQSALALTMKDVTDIIKGYLGVESPTELGALKDIDKWPRNLVNTFSNGIRAEMGGLNASLGSMVAPAVVEGGGGNGGVNRTSVTFHVTQNIKDKKTADYTTQELERMIQKHVV